jgi:hypothetical protein
MLNKNLKTGVVAIRGLILTLPNNSLPLSLLIQVAIRAASSSRRVSTTKTQPDNSLILHQYSKEGP